MLNQFRERLSQVTTVEEALALGRPIPAGSGKAVVALRRGLAALRMSELSADRRFLDEAIQWFDDAALQAPGWPYPWFGLAVAKVALHRRDALVKASRNQPEGMSYFEGYTRAISAVFQRDSLFAPAIKLIRQTLREQGERAQPEALLSPLRRVAAGPLGAREDALILARDYRRRGQSDSALIFLDLYRQHGGDAGMAELERAHTLATLGSPEAAASAYRNGLYHITAESRSAYRADVAWIADTTELASFDRTPDDSLAGWVAEFWRWRDVKELRHEGERLQEHLRRWAFVDSHYRVVHPEGRTQFAATRATMPGPCNRGDYFVADDILGDTVVRPADGRRRERLYDDRAYVYMRHGEPALRIGGKGPYEIPGAVNREASGTIDSVPADADAPQLLQDLMRQERLEDARANESWLYWFGGDRRVFNFEGSMMLGRSAPTTLSVELLPDLPWLELRSQLDPGYQRLANLLEHHATLRPGFAAFGCERLVQIAVAKNRADAGVGLRSDSYTLLFRHEIQSVVQVYAVGRPDRGTGRLLVVFAVPGEQLVAETGEPNRPAGVLYPVETRVSASDSAQRVSRALDSTRQFLAPDTLHAGSHLTGYVELPVPPGLYRVGTALLQPGKDVGGVTLRDGLDLRLPESRLYLSDLVLGRQGSGLAWSYGGEIVLLNPLGAFPRTESTEVFYELSGLTPGRTYVTTMELAPVKGGRSGKNIRLRFTQIAEGDELTVRRSLGLDRVKRGQYQLSVEISEEGSSRKVRREQFLTISE